MGYTTSTAKAHMLHHAKHMTHAQRVSYANRTVYHALAAIRWAAHHKHSLTVIVGFDWWASYARGHRWLLRYGQHLKRQLYLESLPPHYKGWICIHNNEAAWNDKGWPYYGGLQMSYGWMGVVTDASLLTPLQQMWKAEIVSRKHGFSYDWMKGQWPNTYPPCIRYFSAA